MGIYDKELTCSRGGYIWVEENSNLILPLTVEFSIICGWTDHLWLHAWVSLLKLLLFIVLNSLLSWLHGMAKTAKAPWYCSIFIFCTTKCTNYTNSVSQKHHVKNGGQNTYNCPTAQRQMIYVSQLTTAASLRCHRAKIGDPCNLQSLGKLCIPQLVGECLLEVAGCP